MRIRLCMLGALVISVATGVAWAVDEPTAVQVADAVVTAAEASDTEALARLAASFDPDAWMVAEALCQRGKRTVALAFADAVDGKDGEQLPAYVRSWKPLKSAGAALKAALAAADPEQKLKALAGVEETQGVVGLQVLEARGSALLALRRFDDARPAFERFENAAASLGAWNQASRAIYFRGVSYAMEANYPAAVAQWKRRVALDKERGDERGVAASLGNIGGMVHRLGDDRQAALLFEEAVEISSRLGLKDREVMHRRGLASALEGLGAPKKSLQQLEKALALAKDVKDGSLIGVVTQAIGSLSHNMGLFQKALDFQQRALQMAEDADDDEGQSIALGNLGRTYEEMELFGKAEDSYRRSAKLLAARHDVHNLPVLHVSLGRLLVSLGRVNEALALLEQAAAAAQKTRQGALLLDAMQVMGRAHLALSEDEQAEKLFGTLIQLRERQGDEKRVIGALGTIGTFYARLDRATEAKDYFGRAMKRAKQTNDQQQEGVNAANLAFVEARLGNYDRAIALQQRAQGIFEAMRDPVRGASARNQLATLHSRRGHFAEALRLFDQSLEDARKRGDRKAEAVALSNLGATNEGLRDLDKAEALYRAALKILQARGDAVRAVAVRGNVANVLAQQGDHHAALAEMKEIRAKEQELGLPVKAAQTLGSMGVLYRDMGRTRDAIAAMQGAIQAMEIAKLRREVVVNQANLAGVFLESGQLEQALATAQSGLATADELELLEMQALLWGTVAAAHLASGAHADAMSASRKGILAQNRMLRGLSESEGATARADRGTLYDRGLDAALQLGDMASATWFLESGRAGTLLESLESRRTVELALIPAALLRLRDASRSKETAAMAAYRVASMGGSRKQTRAAKRAVLSAREEAKVIAVRIEREAKAAAEFLTPEPAGLADIQAGLAADQALLVYGLLDPDAVVLVVTRDGARIEKLGTTAAIGAQVEQLALDDAEVDASTSLAALRRLTIAPARLPKAIKRLLIAPDGCLSTVPFVLLAQQHEVTYVPSGTTYLNLRANQKPEGRGVLALGDPIYRKGQGGATRSARGSGIAINLSPLPGTRAEVKAIGTRVLLGKQATERNFTSALGEAPGGRWHAVHLACHGLVDAKDPMDSALAITPDEASDGFLSVRDLLTLKIPADLVALSACETARGTFVQREGILGLTRAFMVAGAPRILASLWKVDDKATSALMQKFYELWGEADATGERMGAAAALRQAQAFVRDQDKWQHPYYWAAWSLWGLPD